MEIDELFISVKLKGALKRHTVGDLKQHFGVRVAKDAIMRCMFSIVSFLSWFLLVNAGRQHAIALCYIQI